jgi:hypothetical protein
MRKRYLTAILALAFSSGCCAFCRDRASTYYPPVYVAPEPMPQRLRNRAGIIPALRGSSVSRSRTGRGTPPTGRLP